MRAAAFLHSFGLGCMYNYRYLPCVVACSLQGLKPFVVNGLRGFPMNLDGELLQGERRSDAAAHACRIGGSCQGIA